MAPQRQGGVKGGERNEGEEGRLKHRSPLLPSSRELLSPQGDKRREKGIAYLA